MSSASHHLSPCAIITGWDFSTGGVKCLAFDLSGKVVAEARLPTDLWTNDGVSELNLLQLEGQAYASCRAIASKLREIGRLNDWIAAGVSATHHTSGRIDRDGLPVRRAICWNDHSLAPFHERGLERLGGQERARKLIGGPWASRYGLSHLVKDEALLPMEDWKRTWRILPHGALATGYLTGNFDVVSISSAASTGIMDLQTGEWRRQMLAALESPAYRRLAWQQLPGIQDYREPVGRLSSSLALALGIRGVRRPYLFPSSDDQQAGLVGGGAVDDGHVAIILGNSAVVNSSSAKLPTSTNLDVMRLSWGPYLLMRCYNNGAQFLDAVVGPRPNWKELEAAARACHPGCDGVQVLPFLQPEPSLAVHQPVVRWIPSVPDSVGARYRVALESLAYMIAKGVAEHKAAGQNITRVTVSGGIARGNLMCEILASVLNRPLERLKSDEGPALGAAVLALTGMADQLGRTRKNAPRFELPDAVRQLVRFGTPVQPNGKWQEAYRSGFNSFCRHLPER